MKKIRAFDVLGNIAIVNFNDFARSPCPPARQRLRRGQKIASRSCSNKKISIKEKKKFAQELLKRHNNIKTVLEKKGKVRGRLRKISTRHLAGEKSKEVLYNENGCVFRFNIDTTYFSPRLSNERKEIASKIKSGESVLVMFAGVAPFSIVIAKKSGARVVSNEINREANKYAKLNVELNHLKNRVEVVAGDVKRVVGKWKKMHSQVRGMDGSKQTSSSFSQFLINDKSIRAKRGNLPKFDVIVMPRPRLKDTFLEQAFKLSKKGTRIYYYDFCKEGEEKLIVEKIKQEAKKFRKKVKILKTKTAGEIAPYKIRVRVDIRVL
ncbi:MAG: hypothetical protein ABIB79_02685 [archaeon]